MFCVKVLMTKRNAPPQIPRLRLYLSFNPLFLLTVGHTIVMMMVRRIWVGSINNPIIDIVQYSGHLYIWNCIVKRKSALVIYGN